MRVEGRVVMDVCKSGREGGREARWGGVKVM